MADEEDDNGSKVIVTAVAVLAGLVAQQLVGLGWRAVRGNRPRKDDDSPLSDALVFAAVSAATAAAARTWATRKAQEKTAKTG